MSLAACILVAGCGSSTRPHTEACGLIVHTGRNILAPMRLSRPSSVDRLSAPAAGYQIPPIRAAAIANELWRLTDDCHNGGVAVRVSGTRSTYTVGVKAVDHRAVAIALAVAATDFRTGKIFAYRNGRLVGVGSLG
jgi:hypothetical protein